MQHHIINTYQDFLDLKDYVSSNDFSIIVLDTETDNKIERLANLYGVGICFEDHEAFYIPVKLLGGASNFLSEEEKHIAQWIYDICKTKKLIGHNIVYDVLVVERNWGFDLTPFIYSDTILQKHAVDEERPFALKEIAVNYLGAWADKAQKDLYDNIKANGGSTTKENLEIYKADMEVIAEYCAWDCILCLKLFNIFEKRIQDEGLTDLFYNQEIMPLYKEVTIPMKQRGFPIDVEYFKDLNFKISEDIKNLEDTIQKEIAPHTFAYVDECLEQEYPAKRSGHFPKYAAEMLGLELPKGKTGKVTLAQKELFRKFDSKLNAVLDDLPDPVDPKEEMRNLFLSWLLGKSESLPKPFVREVQERRFFMDNAEDRYLFNLKSNEDLKYLFFDVLKQVPLSQTEGGKPQVDDDFLESIKEAHPFAQKLLDFKRLNKLKSTYIEGALESQINGVIYASYIQFGPPSGRYACRGYNLQNIPRLKGEDSGLSERILFYVNAIKRGFIAPKGNLIVNADYSQLEPRAFAEACEDYTLQKVFIDNEDLYGAIAVRVWNLDCTANEVKKKYPEKRQMAKIIALAVVYGAEAGRISKLMGMTYKEAEKIIEDYLDAYPGLREYMRKCDEEACLRGYVKTKLGRVRHLPEAKRLYNSFGMRLLDKKWAKSKGLEEVRWQFKNMLNLAKNYKIQGMAGHIVNRAAIAIMREFKANGIIGSIVAQVHDELCFIVKAEFAELAKRIIKRCMETTTNLIVPLKVDPIIASSWDEAK